MKIWNYFRRGSRKKKGCSVGPQQKLALESTRPEMCVEEPFRYLCLLYVTYILLWNFPDDPKDNLISFLL